MVNILPQAATFNTGAWGYTEVLIECYRDISTLNVYGGVLWGDDKTNDHFVKSHGVRTPDAYWKLVQRQDTGGVIAFIIPNDDSATKSSTEKYIVSIAELEEKLKTTINTGNVDKQTRSRLWPKPLMCNIS